MNVLGSALASLCLAGVALADTSVSLLPMKGDKDLEVVTTKNITGSCGASIVRVLGITNTAGNFYNGQLTTRASHLRHGEIYVACLVGE